MVKVNTGLGNYYGGVELQELNSEYYLTLENYDGFYAVCVSEEFAKAMIKEFKKEKEKVYLESL